MKRRDRRNGGRWGRSVLASLLVVGGLGGLGLPVVAATCVLEPQLRAITANQGIGSYATVARGKETLVRLYLSLPSCAASGSSIKVTGASLTADNGSGVKKTVSPFSPTPTSTPEIVAAGMAPAFDSDGDPKFVLPGTYLAPSYTTARFDVTFTATVNYQATANSTSSPVVSSKTFDKLSDSTPLKVTVERKTNALRLLVVPMGDGHQTYSSQFGNLDKITTQNGLTTLARLLPVPDGTGDLTSTARGGVRYRIAPTLLDLSSLMTAGKFCGKSTTWGALQSLLLGFLSSWNAANTANPAATADRVLGVVSENISVGGSGDCVDGYATFGEKQAWVRAIADTAFAPSKTGALMAMEIGHTLGAVPPDRDDDFNVRHSPNVAAVPSTALAPNRGYNVDKRAFVPNDRSAMKVSPSGAWNNTNVLFEAADWAWIQCQLSNTASTACPSPGKVGSAVGVGANPTLTITGRTDGTRAGTDVVESGFAPGGFAPGGLLTEPDPTSVYRLVQRDGATILRDDGVEVSFEESQHDGGAVFLDNPFGVFSVAFPFDTGANSIELWNGTPDGPTSVLLYARDRTAPPTLTSVNAQPPSTGTAATERASVSSAEAQTTSGSTGAQPSISADGRFVAFPSTATNLSVEADTNAQSDIFVRDRQSGTTERVSVSDSEAQATGGPSTDPVISGDGRYVAFVSSATNLVPGDTNGQPDIFLRDRQAGATVRVSVATAGTQANNRSIHPSISDDGNLVAFTSLASNLVTADTNSTDDVFVHNLTTAVTERASVSTSGTATITSTTGAVVGVAAPVSVRPNAAVSDDDIIAFDEQPGDAPSARAPAGGLNVDVTNGTADRTHALSPSTIPAGTTVKTHLLHADRPNNPVDFKSFTGTATFGADILGVIVRQSRLEATDGLSSVGTTYPVANDPQLQGLRGLDFPTVSTSNDAVTISADRRTLTVNFEVQNIMDEVRVITEGDTIEGNGVSERPDLSGDGRYIAFESLGSNLVPGDTSLRDVFLRDLQLDATERVSLTDTSGASDGASMQPAVSRGGRYVAFASDGSNLVTADTNGSRDIFLRDRQAGTTERVNLTSAGAQTGGATLTAEWPAISDDGRFVAFVSSATDLVTGDTNGQLDVFRRDRQTSATARVSITTSDGEATGGFSAVANASHLSADGRVTVFYASATNLVPGDSNGAQDVFVRDQAPPAVGQQAITLTSSDDFPDDVRADLLYTCPDGSVDPVAVGVRPEALAGASASFERNFDAALACAGGTLNAALSDGFTRTTPNPVNEIPVVSDPKPPTAAIETPGRPADLVSPFDSVALKGTGKDPETGELTDPAALEWLLTAPGGSPVVVGSGGNVDLASPTGGWAPGTYTVRLKVTDPAGSTGIDTSSFQVRAVCHQRVCSNGNPSLPGVVHPVALSKAVSLRVNKPDPCSSNYGPTCTDPAGSATTVSAPGFAGDPGAQFEVMLCNAQALTEPNADRSGGAGDYLGGCDYGNGAGLGPLGVPNSGSLTLDAGGNLPGNVNLEMPANATLTPFGGGASTDPAAVCPPTAAQVVAGWTCIVYAAEYDAASPEAPPREASYRQVFLKSPIPAMSCGGGACPSSVPTGTSVTLNGVQFPCKTIQPDDPTTTTYDGFCSAAWTNKTILLKRVSTGLIEGAAIAATSQVGNPNGTYTITFTMPSVAAPGETYKIVPHAPACSFPCESGAFNAAGRFFRHA